MPLSTLVEASPNAIAEIEQSPPHALLYIDCSPACGEWYTSTHEGVDAINTICIKKFGDFLLMIMKRNAFKNYVLQVAASAAVPKLLQS